MNDNHAEDGTAELPEVPADGDLFAADTHGFTSPSTAGLYRELKEELEETRVVFTEPIVRQEPPPYVAGTIDVADFVRSQARFIAAQMEFMRTGRKDNPDYTQILTNYSISQGEYINAMSTVLRTLGVI